VVRHVGLPNADDTQSEISIEIKSIILLCCLSCRFGSEISTKTGRRKLFLAPIRTLLYSKPIIGVKLNAWLVSGYCWHFYLLSGLLLSQNLVTQKTIISIFAEKMNIAKYTF